MPVDRQPALSSLVHDGFKHFGSHHFVDFNKAGTGLVNRRDIGAGALATPRPGRLIPP